MEAFQLTNQVRVGPGQKLVLFAGPCQIESLDHCLMIAEHLQEICRELPIQLVFKSSYDKANRTSLDSKRGLGIEEGLQVLDELRSRTGLPVISDIHSPADAKLAGEVLDVLQTPAFLCRQTDLLLAAGQTGKPIHVKKGQFLHPDDMKHAAGKIASTGNKKILLCERGACFGYRDLVVDLRSLAIMRSLGYPVSFDATHSVQTMGAAGGKSGGKREFIPMLARAAAAAGIDALFMECHEEPERAPSDGASMMPLQKVASLLHDVCRIREVLGE